MAQQTNIGWTDSTFNPVRGCTKISPGCAHCYAARESIRFPRIRGIWGDAGTRIVAIPSKWDEPRRWDNGPRRRVFCASLGDVFEDWKGLLHYPCKELGIAAAWWRRSIGLCRAGQTTIGLTDGDRLATMDDMRLQLFQLIMQTPNLDWQLLTKRPENILPMIDRCIRLIEALPDWDLPEHPLNGLEKWLYRWAGGKPPENVWLGTTCENQEEANKRIPHLLKVPAKVRFLSCEPLLGPVALPEPVEGFGDGLDWVICGGESGPQARPMDPAWARGLRDQCAVYGVPFFFKQWGEWGQVNEVKIEDGRALNAPILMSTTETPRPWRLLRDDDKILPGNVHMRKVGTKASGNLLDGKQHLEFPRL